MELKEILAISGQPGLYKYVAQSTNGVIVESLLDGKRMNASASSKVSALTEISIFTEGDDLPLADVRAAAIDRGLAWWTLSPFNAGPGVDDRQPVRTEDGETVSHLIVHPAEAGLDTNRISSDSPLAAAILGHEVGREVTIEAPSGPYTATIVESLCGSTSMR